MSQYHMKNLVDELPNQVDLENDLRWMGDPDKIQALITMLDVTHGSWVVMVKAKAGSAMSIHYHTKPLYVFTFYGHWYYPEHDWEAKTGHFLYEVPGELHTPTFKEDTLLYSVVAGPIIYPGQNVEPDKVTDIYSHVESVKKHYQSIGLTDKDFQKILR